MNYNTNRKTIQKKKKLDGSKKVKIYPPKKWKITDTSKEMNNLFRELSFLFYSKPKKKESVYLRRTKTQNQLCMTKMYYGTDKKTHLNFLRVYMSQENKKEVEEKPTLFSATKNKVDNEDILKYEQGAADSCFKFILSPESKKIPLQLLVRSFMETLQKNTGIKMTWLAVEHHDTNNPHAHILINGVDINKKEFRIPKETIKTARLVAGEICTKIVGVRTKEQIEESKKRMIFAKRFCKIDERIKTHYRMFPSIKTQVSNTDTNEYEGEIIARDEEMQKRLEELTKMGLARKFNKNIPPIFYLEKLWEEKLRNIGRYNTFLQARNDMRWTESHNLELYKKETGEIRGLVTKIYTMDEEGVYNNSLIVENKKEKKAYFIKTFKHPDETLLNTVVRVQFNKSKEGKEFLNINRLDTSGQKK